MYYQIVLPVGIIAILFMSMYGLGVPVSRAAYGNAHPSVSFTITLGCGVCIFIGGVLNLTSSATPFLINSAFFGGIVLALVSIALQVNKKRLSGTISTGGNSWSFSRMLKMVFRREELPLLTVLCLGGFFTVTLVPTGLFNIVDDFQTYLIYPIRMLFTGSASGGEDDLLGYGTLGAQSIFQSFLLLHFPLRYISSIEPVFFFLISGLLVDAIGKRAGLQWSYRLLAVLVFAFINPQSVNISPLYSGSMTILAIVYGSMIAVEIKIGRMAPLLRCLSPVAFLLACLITLKVSFLVFSLVYAFIFIALLNRAGWGAAKTLVAGFCFLAVLCIAGSPWIALAPDAYLEIIKTAIGNLLDLTSDTDAAGQLVALGPAGLLLTERINWGGSYLGYAFVLVVIGLSGVVSAGMLWWRRKEQVDYHLIVGLALFSASIVSCLVMGYQAQPATAIRYSIPILIAAIPMTLILLAGTCPPALSAGNLSNLNKMGRILLVGHFVVLGQFMDVFAYNLGKAYSLNGLMAGNIVPQFIQYNKYVVEGAARSIIRAVQQKVPAGEKLFVWAGAPFFLDFSRNHIIALDTPGIEVLTRKLNGKIGYLELRNHFQARGIRYLLWEYKGTAVRNRQWLQMNLKRIWHREAARKNLDLINAMDLIKNRHVQLFDNGGMTLIDLGG